MIIDSDVVSRTATSNILERSGFNIVTAVSSEDALQKLKRLTSSERPNIIVVDSMVGDISGVEVCKVLRGQKFDAQIILVVQKDDDLEALKGAANVFDDHLFKPFSKVDLTYKIKILLGKAKPTLQAKVVSFQDITLNLASYKVTRAGRSVHLGPTEFKLLQCFIENPTKIFSRKELMDYIWSDQASVETRTIDVHVNRLRTALKLPNEHVPVIKTIRAAGYCLHLPEKIYVDA
jgi:two-component system phosphate regulon response regulator PhoB